MCSPGHQLLEDPGESLLYHRNVVRDDAHWPTLTRGRPAPLIVGTFLHRLNDLIEYVLELYGVLLNLR